jgi:hypothetical protein
MIFKKINNGNELYALFYENSHIRGRYTAFIRGKRSTTCSGFLKEYSAAFQFPYYYGNNWSAWDECATDLSWLMFDSVALIIDDYESLFVDEPDNERILADVEKELRYIENYWQKRMFVPFYVFACIGFK